MNLVFEGVVQCCDGYRCSDEEEGAIRIGGRDVVDEVMEAKPGKRVQVYLNDELVADGMQSIEMGWGYSSWTPVDCDTFTVSGGTIEADMIELLTGHEGKGVVLRIVSVDEE